MSIPSSVPVVEEELAVEREFLASKGFVVAVTAARGGVGKTTTALCVASTIYHASKVAVDMELRADPLSVCIVDLDARDGQVGYLLQQLSPTALNLFAEVSMEGWPLDESTLLKNLVYSENLGVHALLAPKRARDADRLEPGFYKLVLARLQELFDVVVIDTSANYLDPSARTVAYPIADAVLFVTNLSTSSVSSMPRWLEENTRPVDHAGDGVPMEKIGVIVNQYATNLGFSEERILEATSGAQVVAAIPLDAATVVNAANGNHLDEVILHHPHLSDAYFQVALRLLPDEVLVPPAGEPDV